MYLFLPNNVFAQTRCRNEWYTSDATASKEIILLSTGNDDNVLTETNSSSLSLAFAKKKLKGIRLNDNGSCPSVSFCKNGSTILIYKNNNCKEKSSIKDSNKKFCTDVITEEIDTSDRLDNNITGNGD